MKAIKENRCKWTQWSVTIGHNLEDIEYYYHVECCDDNMCYSDNMADIGDYCPYCAKIKEMIVIQADDRVTYDISKNYLKEINNRLKAIEDIFIDPLKLMRNFKKAIDAINKTGET